MPTAEGYIKYTAGGRLTVSFLIDGLNYTLSGAFTSDAPPFASLNGRLTYSDIHHLTSPRSFHGQLGPEKVVLNLENGPKITGNLDMPISPGSSISGSGVWTQNELENPYLLDEDDC